MLLTVSVAEPIFVRVTVCGPLVVPTCWLLKVRVDGVSVIYGTAEALPNPDRLTTLVVPGPLSVIVNVAVFSPVVAGLKVTVNLQKEPGLTTAASQVLLLMKSAVLITIELIVIGTAL